MKLLPLLRILPLMLLPLACLAEEPEEKAAKEQKSPAFFPARTFDPPVVARYSGHLAAMKEEALPPLARNKDAVVYRFTCLETFGHPFSIKITRTKTGYQLRRTVLSGRGGYAPGGIKESVEAELKPEEVAGLEKLLVEAKFKDLKASDVTEDYNGGSDGSQWFVETVKDGKYRIVDRWAAGEVEDAPIRKIGAWFLATAKWQPEGLPTFFPPDTLEEYHAKHLLAMNEAPLPPLAGEKGAVVYRLSAPPDNEPGFSIRITKTETGYHLRRVVISGQLGFGSGKIRESVEADLPPEALAELAKLLAEPNFKEMKTELGEPVDDGGPPALLEVLQDGQYKVIARSLSDKGSPVAKIADAFFEAAKWKPQELPAFFPPGTFDGFTVKWYSPHLVAMKEEVLPPLAKNKDAVVYRFTCLRTFHQPFSIKLTKTAKGYHLRRSVLSGKGGYDPGELEKSADSDLKPEALAGLEKLLLGNGFKDMKPTADDEAGLDGSQWIVEVVKDGTYQVVDRWSPREGQPMRQIGEWFLGAAKWKPKELY